MINDVSLTYFIDFVLTTGSTKLSVVRDFKERGDYENGQSDFYKKVREAIVATARKQQPLSTLDAVLAGLTDVKKQTAYPPIIAGYKIFAKKNSGVWFSPPKTVWGCNGLPLRVNPELGITIRGVEHAIKMYFKEPPLKPRHASMVLHAIAKALHDPKKPRAFAVLDVRRGKLHLPPKKTLDGADIFLEAEAAAFLTMFAKV